MLAYLKDESNMTRTENGAVTYVSAGSDCLDLFATIGALRGADEAEIARRFTRAYAENADLAMKTLFFARDVRGGLGERRVFRVILRWLAFHEPQSVRKNISYIGMYGRFDDLLALFDTPCEGDAIACIKTQLEKDLQVLAQVGEVSLPETEHSPGHPAAAPIASGEVSLLAKWLPSVNASNRETVRQAKKLARALSMTDAAYRKCLSALRAHIRIIENNLREKDYSFEYEKQPSRALFKYRKAFLRNDSARYQEFLSRAEESPSLLHTGTLTPYDIIAPAVTWDRTQPLSEEERRSMDVTWRAQEDFTGGENALVVVDGSASMYYWGGSPLPAAVAQSLGIYFAERNTGLFRNHFITFSANPRLVEVKGRDIVEKVRYCMQFNDCANTDLQKVFELILQTAVRHHLPQAEMPTRLYIISDMEFDCCDHADVTNFAWAKAAFASAGYELPTVVFWNVQSRHMQQPVTQNEQGAILVSGCSPQIFSMLQKNLLDPYHFMLDVLCSERYEAIAA